MRPIEVYFPLSHGGLWVDGRRIGSGFSLVMHKCLRCCGAAADHGLPNTIYNRAIRWSRLGVLNKIFAGPAATYGPPRWQAVCIRCSKQSAKTYPAFRRITVGQDGDPRVLVLIRGRHRSAILRHRVPRHRSTVRPSSSHLPQTSSSGCQGHRPISFTPPALWVRRSVRGVEVLRRSAPFWPQEQRRRCFDAPARAGRAPRRPDVYRSCSSSAATNVHPG